MATTEEIRGTGLHMGREDEHAGLGYEELSHGDLLRRVREDVESRGLLDIPLIDADFHQTEDPDWQQILGYVDNDVIGHLFRTARGGQPFVPGAPQGAGLQELAARIRPNYAWNAARKEKRGATTLLREAAEMMGVNRVVLFPQHLLGFGRGAFPELEIHIARAYARWLVEDVVGGDSPVLASLYLPFSDADACVELIEEYGDRPGVVAATTVTNRYEPTHDKSYLRLYAALEERGMPLMFHAGIGYNIAPQAMFNRFISVHGISFPYLAIVQATNWIINALPERFPNLNVVFVEGGLSWIPFLMQRLDHMVMMRSSEVPNLQKLPSEYLRDFYYTTQPLEATNMRELKATLEFINAPDQLLWASDWPHWDWDPPARIWDVPFLSEDERRDILGRNAMRLFNLSEDEVLGGTTPAASPDGAR